LGSAFLCVILRSVTEYFYVTPFAILMMNALTPWIDMWFLPSGIPAVAKKQIG